jgi:predicted enzyme related to lactoylglutathione lyase
MAVITSYRPGTFSWVDLAAHDVDAAERFYTQLFGWTADRMQFGPADDEVYVMLRREGRDAAALYAMDPTQKSQGMPSSWLSYVTVESAEEAAAKARGLGATVLADAFEVMDAGRMALLGDPEGAMFAVWEPMRHLGAGVRDEPGSLCWNELATRDMARATAFYGALFGWTAAPVEGSPTPYSVMMNGGAQAGGIYDMCGEMAGRPPRWAPYFAVDDADDAARRAEELGGRTLLPPHDSPGIGRYALLLDPQGASFYVIKLLQAQS